VPANIQRYRLGEYQRTQELYDELLSTCDSVSLIICSLNAQEEAIHAILATDEQSSSEHPDIVDNLSATSTHLEFLSHGYHSALSAPAAQASSDLPHHTPTEGELETYVPSLPTGWATGGVQTKKPAVPVKLETVEKKKKKSRHALPKGAVSGKPANEDVSVDGVSLHRPMSDCSESVVHLWAWSKVWNMLTSARSMASYATKSKLPRCAK
jgi:signal recognition particle subunit SRP72